jgi:hypothetical protein
VTDSIDGMVRGAASSSASSGARVRAQE